MDVAIFSGRIYTGNPAQPWAEAVKIENEHITHVGSIDEIKDACANTTEMLEMPGCLVTPGLVDAHCHFVSLGLAFQLVNLSDASSLAEVCERIRKAAATRKPGDWLVGRGWNHHQWIDPREPSRRDLDDILPDNPAMMVRACGHSIWVNSAALQLAGVTRDTPPSRRRPYRQGSGQRRANGPVARSAPYYPRSYSNGYPGTAQTNGPGRPGRCLAQRGHRSSYLRDAYGMGSPGGSGGRGQIEAARLPPAAA